MLSFLISISSQLHETLRISIYQVVTTTNTSENIDCRTQIDYAIFPLDDNQEAKWKNEKKLHV